MDLHLKQLFGAIGLGALGWLFVLLSICLNFWFFYGTRPYHINAGIFQTCGENFCYSNDVGAGPYLGRVFGFITLTSVFAVIALTIYCFKYIRRSSENVLYPCAAIFFYVIVGISGFLTVVIFSTLGKSDIELILKIRAGTRVEMNVSFCLGLMLIGIFLNTMSLVATILHLKNMPSTPADATVAPTVGVDTGKV